MNEEKLKLNKKGYDEYLKAIQEKEKQLAAVRMYKGTDAIYQGDNCMIIQLYIKQKLKKGL